MNRRTFPAGQASTAALLKALMRGLVEEKGQSVADGWLRAAISCMVRADLDDETRMVPLSLRFAPGARRVRRGGVAGGHSAGGKAPRRARQPRGMGARHCVVPTRQRTRSARLHGADSEYGRTVRWETIRVAPGYWQGRSKLGARSAARGRWPSLSRASGGAGFGTGAFRVDRCGREEPSRPSR